jgi:hypothetical protein
MGKGHEARGKHSFWSPLACGPCLDLIKNRSNPPQSGEDKRITLVWSCGVNFPMALPFLSINLLMGVAFSAYRCSSGWA